MDQQARTGSQLRSAGFQQAQNLAQQASKSTVKTSTVNWSVGCITSWSWTTWTTNGSSRY